MKEMSKFIGWAFFGNGVCVLRDQGTNILLNIFLVQQLMQHVVLL